MINRLSILTLLLSALSLSLLTGAATAAEKAVHKVAIHLDDNDPKRMNMALNNVANLRKYYDSIGETVEVELVAYGPGLHIFRADTSPVKDRIEAMSMEIDNLTFSACGNTHAAMSRASGKDVDLLEGVDIVPSGVVRLIALQEQGYSYIRP
ncbi:MAG: DsrE family protein [Ectothiorhodospiraceae bacterium AqS1]|nr:DsrE family protein [Ectothiorhodospiraceae bacterium AqS1]